jgi:hypothetical protein
MDNEEILRFLKQNSTGFRATENSEKTVTSALIDIVVSEYFFLGKKSQNLLTNFIILNP